MKYHFESIMLLLLLEAGQQLLGSPPRRAPLLRDG
jgi:hypothetical protein